MQRIVEPELMEGRAQAEAYARADFEEPHSRIVEVFFDHFRDVHMNGNILDLGCGPGDIAFRFAGRCPVCSVIGVDGSDAMIDLAERRQQQVARTTDNMTFIRGSIPDVSIPPQPYSAIISNSLLHHLHRPQVLWQTISRYSGPGTKVFIADLFRPSSPEEAREIVNKYAADELSILREDFYHSLLAAFTPREVEDQLVSAGLSELSVKKISDRHLLVVGTKK